MQTSFYLLTGCFGVVRIKHSRLALDAYLIEDPVATEQRVWL